MQEFTNSFDSQRFGLRQQVAAGDYEVTDAGVRQASWATTARGELCIVITAGNTSYEVAVQSLLSWHTQAAENGQRRLLVPEALANNTFAGKLREVLAGCDTLGKAKEALLTLKGTKVKVAYSKPLTLYRKDGTKYDTMLMLIDLI